MVEGLRIGDGNCHAALKSRKMDFGVLVLHSNRGNQGAFVLKSRTEWMGADAT
jgi:hypothetical protein